jgi:hypothetical protein
MMEKIDENMDQFLTDLRSMKAQLIRCKSATTSPAALKVSELKDIHLNIDVLLARLQLNSLGLSRVPSSLLG